MLKGTLQHFKENLPSRIAYLFRLRTIPHFFITLALLYTKENAFTYSLMKGKVNNCTDLVELSSESNFIFEKVC